MKRKEGLTYQTKSDRKIVRYATKARMAKVNPKNIKIYERYLKSRIIHNSDVKDTTYKVYHSYMNIFMCYIAEEWDNFYLLDEDMLEDEMIDVMEGYMAFLADECGNGKKVINTKLSAVSSFYLWATKRGMIRSHPFDGKLDRIKNAQDEKKISVHFLHEDKINQIYKTLEEEAEPEGARYDYQDRLIWEIAFYSACRIGALYNLSLSNLKLDENKFVDIRDKRGKRVEVPFTNETKELIKKFLKWREDNGIDTDAFFVNRLGGHMSKQAMSIRIRKIGEIVGVGDFRAHSIRKSRLNQVGQKNIELAKQLAHHESMDTTARFYMEKKSETATLKEIDALLSE